MPELFTRLIECYQLLLVVAVLGSWLRRPRWLERSPARLQRWCGGTERALLWLPKRLSATLPLRWAGVDFSPLFCLFGLEIVRSTVATWTV